MDRTIRIAILAIVALLPGVVRQASAQSTSTPPGAVGNGGGRTYVDSQVDKPAAPDRSNAPPEYPELLRREGVEGTVMAQFVVDTTGRADVTTFRVLKPAHPLFVQAVRNALPKMKFSPAERDGRKVKQLVRAPFAFRIACLARPWRMKPICR